MPPWHPPRASDGLGGTLVAIEEVSRHTLPSGLCESPAWAIIPTEWTSAHRECPQGLRLCKQIFHVGALTWFYDAQQVRPLLESQAEPADFSPARVRLVSVRQGV